VCGLRRGQRGRGRDTEREANIYRERLKKREGDREE